MIHLFLLGAAFLPLATNGLATNGLTCTSLQRRAIMSEDQAAKAAWLARLDEPRKNTEEEAKRAWLDKLDKPFLGAGKTPTEERKEDQGTREEKAKLAWLARLRKWP